MATKKNTKYMCVYIYIYVYMYMYTYMYNRFLLLINPRLIINNKSGNPKMPHEHFKRGCTNFKRSKTIMN